MTTTLGKSILLDSSIIIHHLRAGSSLFEQPLRFSEFFLPNVALAELYFGAHRSNRVKENLLQIQHFLKQVVLVFPDDEITKTYGYVAANLARIGKSISQNDIWIAATALHLDLPLATLDRHFEYVDRLTVVLW